MKPNFIYVFRDLSIAIFLRIFSNYRLSQYTDIVHISTYPFYPNSIYYLRNSLIRSRYILSEFI